jgi:hypothetical protein
MRTRCRISLLRAVFALGLLLAAATAAEAEPYIAAQKGLKCTACHVNPTGGGLRNATGHAIAQNELAARRLDMGDVVWTGELNRFFAVGGDFRGSASYTDISGEDDVDPAFETDELRAYLEARVIPERLSLYVDQRLAPGDSRNLEAYGLFWLDEERQYYVKAGQIYLPFGLRLEDDSAFVRQVPGINMDTPDNGVELGLETGPWSVQLALSNGSAGGPEFNTGKQYSLRGEYVRSAWRLGGSASFNDADDTERLATGIFGALLTGPVVWLAEIDYVEDTGLPTGDLARWVGLIEADWRPRQGHNLKATIERHEPDTDVDDDEVNRYSLVYEYTPVQYLQLRAGARANDGAAGVLQPDSRLVFLELHAYF